MLCCINLDSGGEDIVTVTPDLQGGPRSDNTVHGRPCQRLEVIGRGTCTYMACLACAFGRETRCQLLPANAQLCQPFQPQPFQPGPA